MMKVVLEGPTAERLRSLQRSVELVDAQGRRLGWFVPSSSLVPPISDEEIDRRERQGGGRTLAEILADLERRA